MRNPSIACLVPCCFLLVASPLTPALAAPPEAPPTAAPDADKELTDQARALHVEGDAHFAKGDHARARAAYLAAWALKKHYRLAASLADVEARLGYHRDAAQHLAFYMRSAPADDPPTAEAKKLYEEVQAKVGAVTLEIHGGEGADVLVDGKLYGTHPLLEPVFVEPGTHEIEVRRGEFSARMERELAAGQKEHVAITIGPVWLGEEPRQPPPGPLEDGLPVRPRTAIWIGAGVAAASLGVGIAMTLLANGESEEREKLRVGDGSESACYALPTAECDALHSAAFSQWNYTLAAGVGYALAVGAVGGTVGYVLWAERRSAGAEPAPAPKATSSKAAAKGVKVEAAPWAGPSGGGVSVWGRF